MPHLILALCHEISGSRGTCKLPVDNRWRSMDQLTTSDSSCPKKCWGYINWFQTYSQSMHRTSQLYFSHSDCSELLLTISSFKSLNASNAPSWLQPIQQVATKKCLLLLNKCRANLQRHSDLIWSFYLCSKSQNEEFLNVQEQCWCKMEVIKNRVYK